MNAIGKVIRSGRSAEARRNAVWASTRIDDENARALSREALKDSDELVRQAAAHSAGVRRDREAVSALIGLLQSKSLHNRRAAAEALGRTGDPKAVLAILDAAGESTDRVLEHSLTYALIEIGDPKATATGLTSQNAHVHQTALIAIDQMEGGDLSAEAVAPYWSRRTKVCGEPPLGSPRAARVGAKRSRLFSASLFPRKRRPKPTLRLWEDQLPRFARSKPIQDLIADRLRNPSTVRASRAALLKIMAQSTLKNAPESWAEALAKPLSGDDLELARLAVLATKAQPFKKSVAVDLAASLLRVAHSEKTPSPLRLDALAAVPEGLDNVDADLFAFLLGTFQTDQPIPARLLAADILTRSRLDREQLLALADLLKSVGPLEVDRLLPTFAQTKDDEVGIRLVNALRRSPALSSLRVNALKPRLANFGPKVQARRGTLRDPQRSSRRAAQHVLRSFFPRSATATSAEVNLCSILRKRRVRRVIRSATSAARSVPT